MNISTRIYREELNGSDRLNVPAKRFGIQFGLLLEPYIYAVTAKLAPEYSGGYWTMYRLSNGGFYMTPNSDERFKVMSPNGYEASLSADALGTTSCLFAYSQMSFTAGLAFADVCAEQYHLLREYMLDQPEAGRILGLID